MHFDDDHGFVYQQDTVSLRQEGEHPPGQGPTAPMSFSDNTPIRSNRLSALATTRRPNTYTHTPDSEARNHTARGCWRISVIIETAQRSLDNPDSLP